MTNKDFYPPNENPRRADSDCPLGGFSGDEDFYLDYVESLTEGDIRPIVLKDYNEDEK